MKRMIIFILILSSILLISCSINKEKTDGNKNIDKITETAISSEDKESKEPEIQENEKNVIEADENSNEDTDRNIDGNNICEIHNYVYHCYPSSFVEYVGSDKFFEWSNNAHLTKDEEGCWPKGNIILCIEKFDISDELIIEAYINDFYNKNWNIKALLEKDAEASEAYARETMENGYDTQLSNEMYLKYRLFDIIKYKKDDMTVEYYNKITDNGTTTLVQNVTIYELVSNTSLTKDDFVAACEAEVKANDEINEEAHFDYNLDLLFDKPEVLSKMIEELDVPYYESRIKLIDALLHI